MKQVVALLPMKGHSERVPNKNMRDFCGRPLYHWILESLLKSKYVDYVVINTDSPRIADDALRHFDRVKIIERPKEIQGDSVSMNEVIAYDLSRIEAQHFLQTHSTNPLLKSTTIDNAISTYFESLEQYDSIFSVTRLQTRLYTSDGRPLNHNPAQLLRTQDLEPIYEENSNLYIFSKTSFMANNRNRLGLNPKMYEIEKLEAIDIDEEEDFILAEVLCKMRIQTN
jgi:CMP-N-acetylneuraminic acid synthetase